MSRLLSILVIALIFTTNACGPLDGNARQYDEDFVDYEDSRLVDPAEGVEPSQAGIPAEEDSLIPQENDSDLPKQY